MNQNQRKNHPAVMWQSDVEMKRKLMSKNVCFKEKRIGCRVYFLCLCILITVAFDVFGTREIIRTKIYYYNRHLSQTIEIKNT